VLSGSIKDGLLLARAFLAALLLVNGASSVSVARTPQMTARVVGTVFDSNGAVVVGALASIKSESFNKEAATNGAGEDEVELPPGIYSIEVRSPGFCRARRASFRALTQNTITFDFTLLICPSHGDGPMSYESFALKADSSEPPDFLIRFGKRTEKESTIEYEGVLTEITYYDSDTKVTDRRQIYVNIAVTYNGWTISASRLTLNKRTLRMELSGGVAILDGLRETTVKSAVVDFALPKPVFNMTH
jgi:Carboxypeptidase regulatory-like domain